MALVPSISALLVPTCTKIAPPLPGPTIVSTLSVIASIIALRKQTITTSCLFSESLPNYRIPHKHPRSPPHPHNHYVKAALASDTLCRTMSCSHVTWQDVSISLSPINMLPFPPVSRLSCALRVFAPVAFPPVAFPPVSFTPVSFVPVSFAHVSFAHVTPVNTATNVLKSSII